MINSDTQRILLLVIFVFSTYMLWQAWEREHNPPPPITTKSAPAPTAPALPADVPAAAKSATAALPPPPGAPVNGAVPAGRKITIKTDLYSADVDTAGGVISQLALTSHRDPFDPAKPYLALQKNAERTFVAQAGLIGDGMPNHRTTYRVLPGARELAPGTDKVELRVVSGRSLNGVPIPPRTFDRFSRVTKEVIDARVWGGIHFRTADVQGTVIGKKVAHWVRKHYFQPLR